MKYFVISDLQTTFHTQLVRTPIVHLYTQFRIPSYKRQIVNISMTARFLFPLITNHVNRKKKTDDCTET
jgi:hypothetical protein